MRHLPLFAALKNRECLIVGGGGVAERRARLLLEAGAILTVQAPAFTASLRALAAEDKRVTLTPQAFDAPVADFEPYWLIIAATDQRDVNAQVAIVAARAKRFCNVVDDPLHCSFIMPAIIDRDPITIAVSSAGTSPVLVRKIKGLIETLVPRSSGALAQLAGAWRERVQAAISSPDERRRFWHRIIDGPTADLLDAGRDDAAAATLREQLEAAHNGVPLKPQGEAWLVGAGPGDPELMTLRGHRLLARADVVLYDRLANPELLKFARRDAKLIPVGKTPGSPSITQEEINALLVELVAQGQRVCRLKGGDPLIFGRGGEELAALVEAGLPFQIVPGISAIVGCAATAGIPLTHRGIASSLTIETGHPRAGRTRSVAPTPTRGETLAYYMGVARAEIVRDNLLDSGHAPTTPAAIVERGTTTAQRVILTELRWIVDARDHFAVQAPALLIIGEATTFARPFTWFANSKPLEYCPADDAERASPSQSAGLSPEPRLVTP